METKKVKLKNRNKSQTVKEYECFCWKLIRENNGYLFFERDETQPKIKEIRKLEKQFFHPFPLPIWVLFILMFFTIAFFTLFGIFNLAIRDVMNSWLTMLVFLLPGVICLGLMTLFSMGLTNSIIKANENYNRRFVEFHNKVKSL